MTKFLYLFRGGAKHMAEMSMEDAQAHMEAWKNWMARLDSEGTLVDGRPLGFEGMRVLNGGSLTVDGPFTEGKEVVGGYLIVNAENMDQAVEISKGCPILGGPGQIEIREIMPMEVKR